MKQPNKKPGRMIFMSRDFTGLTRRTLQRLGRKFLKSFNRNELITTHRN